VAQLRALIRHLGSKSFPPGRTELNLARGALLRQACASLAPKRASLQEMLLRLTQQPQANLLARKAHSEVFETIADAIKRLDHLELVVDRLEFFPQALDMAVDCAIIDIDLVIIGGIH